MKILKDAVTDFLEDNALTLSAALAYYAILSLAPLLIVLTALVALIDPTMQQEITSAIRAEVGPQAGETVAMVMRNAPSLGLDSVMSTLSLIVMLFAATGIFVQLQGALNQIWDVRPKPGLKLSLRLKQRAMPLLMMFLLAPLLLGAVIASWLLRFLLPQGLLLQAGDLLASVALFTLLFALLFKVLPDTRARWADVWVGAVVTAVLFVLARWAIGLYFSYSSLGSAYGAASSVILLLVLVYYSSAVFLFGAEVTQVYARLYGHQIQPKAYAVRVERRQRPAPA